MNTRATIGLVAALAVQGATAQLPKVGEAAAVDVHVQTVTWHPQGLGLLYTKAEGEGQALGVYAMGEKEGKVLLHLGPNERWEAQWFESAPTAVVIVYRQVGVKPSRHSATVYLLDAKTLRLTEAFSETGADDKPIDLDVDTSPKLLHAIFRLKSSNSRRHLILPKGASKLVFAKDLDKAMDEGLSGPVWSVDGTAIFVRAAAGAAPGQLIKVELDNALAVKAARAKVAGAQVIELKLAKEGQLVADDLVLKLGSYLAAIPTPPVGAEVWELMPSNGFLRPVKFKGPWMRDKRPSAPLVSQARRSLLEFGVSKGQANSLWLTLPKEGIDQGVLVAAEASKSWISPTRTSIAYLTDGALFVKPIELPAK